MLRRVPFRSKPPKLHEPSGEREPKPLSRATRSSSYAGSVSGVAIEKEAPVRSEAYRRLVAAMPCINCRKAGPSQCAHANFGKGMALKASDLETFPLCPDCHRGLDQGGMFTKAERRNFEDEWAERTRAAISAAEMWPKNLEPWKGE